MFQPDALKTEAPWPWSPGRGIEVWAMFRACRDGELGAVKELVARDPALVRSHYEYRTPLSFAVRENHLDVAEYLLDLGAARVGLGDPLEIARERGYGVMVELLERKLALLHNASNRGESLAAAIRARDLARLRQLLDESPELLHVGDARSSQPIHWAAMTRQLDVIDELLARGAHIDARRVGGARPIHLGNGDYFYRGWRDVPPDVKATQRETYEHLVMRGATVDAGMAAATGNLARMRELLDADPSLANRASDYNSGYIGSGTPLQNAAGGGHTEMVELLLAHGADPNVSEEHIAPHGKALYSAVYGGHYDIAKRLLELGAWPSQEVESSADTVWIAIRNRDRRMLDLLVSHGAVWSIPIDLDGWLSYRELAALGLRRTLAVLAHYGDLEEAAARLAATPSLADDPGALQAAAGQGHDAFVEHLLRCQPDLAERVVVTAPRRIAIALFKRGMKADRRDWMGIAPLHRFAESGDIDRATLFLDHGADLEAREDESRSRPLAWAARSGREAMVEFLLQRGARPRAPEDPEWATPLAWATRRGHAGIARILTRG
jgi:uncharacterized protein